MSIAKKGGHSGSMSAADVPPPPRPHIPSVDCWCEPTVEQVPRKCRVRVYREAPRVWRVRASCGPTHGFEATEETWEGAIDDALHHEHYGSDYWDD